MAFSYSGLTNYGKSSLPSIESWNTNNNILRDPPRSITTRRIDKVTDNSFFTQEIQDSSDRIAEMIMAYPRGVNPMVGVSYDNSNGGIGRGQALLYRGQQAKLPYRVMADGAFRPPILAPVDLLPLSRMPRNTTCVNPTIFKPDYSKKISCTHEARAVTNKKVKPNCVSQLYMKVDKANPVDVRHTIQTNKQTYAVDGTTKFLPAGDQRARDTTKYLRVPLTGSHDTVKIGHTKNAGSQQAQLLRNPLKGEMSTLKVGPRRESARPIVKTARNPLQGDIGTNKAGLAQVVHHSVMEKAPSKALHYSIPSTQKAGGCASIRDKSGFNARGVYTTSAILLPQNNIGTIPSMERAVLKTRLKVKPASQP